MGLDGFFHPSSVVVIGVGRSADSVGHAVWRNLIEGGFPGEVFAVNPKADEIDGTKVFHSVTDLPSTPELAVIAVPAASVPGVVAQCGVVGISSAIVISAGFKETGPAGAALERALAASAADAGVRIVGPNCLGIFSAHSKLNASFAASVPAPGGVAFLSQSGALGTAILDWMAGRGLGLSTFVSLGNRADVGEAELLEVWREEDETKVVAAYLESVTDGARFIETATHLTAVKPLIVLKSGRTDAGARAVSSHTGSLAGSETAYAAAFAKCGAIRAEGVQDLFDLAEAFELQPLPSGPGLAIVTNAGGPAIMATDACEAAGIALASLSSETSDKLRACLPEAASVYNPVDVLGDAPASRYADALKIVCEDPEVNAVLVVLTPQTPTEPVETARTIAAVAHESGLPTFACFMGGKAVEEARAVLAEEGVPSYPFPERPIRALAAMERYRAYHLAPPRRATAVEADRASVEQIIAEAKDARRHFITEERASAVVAAYGLATPAGGLARSLDEARTLAEKVGYPVAVKIASPDILHKSDIGGIRLGVGGPGELARAWEDVMSIATSRLPDAVVWGAEISAMVPPGREVIIGMHRDRQFGPLLMFGLGGIYVEVLKDVSFRLCPVSEDEARTMISEIRAFGLLRGARGQAPADVDAIVDAIVRVSALASDFPDIVELDVNPLIVADRGEGAVAVDVRIGIGE